MKRNLASGLLDTSSWKAPPTSSSSLVCPSVVPECLLRRDREPALSFHICPRLVWKESCRNDSLKVPQLWGVGSHPRCLWGWCCSMQMVITHTHRHTDTRGALCSQSLVWKRSCEGLGTLWRKWGIFPRFSCWKWKALLSVWNFTRICILLKCQAKVRSCFPDTKSFSLEEQGGKRILQRKRSPGDARRDQGRPIPWPSTDSVGSAGGWQSASALQVSMCTLRSETQRDHFSSKTGNW